VTIIRSMILAFDTSTAACTAALFDRSGNFVAQADEQIGRGHSERLVPMLEELLEGRSAEQILVGVGPGSFTGIRVGLAAGHGLAIGWNAEIFGMSSLALLAASARDERQVAAAIIGGHGELFVQEFDGGSLEARSGMVNLAAGEAARTIQSELVLGSGAQPLVEARGWGESLVAFPSAADAFRLPNSMRRLPPKPIYARAPDARALETV
jgi:tRNA threonylcarbamoyl adenosine modification protein YeaZ